MKGTPPTRRSVLKGVAALGVTALAGCSSDGGGGSGSSGGNSSGSDGGSGNLGAIQNVEIAGQSLDLTLDPSEPVARLLIYGPDGEAWVDQAVPGTASHSVDIITSNRAYTAGTQQLEARDSDGNLVGSAAVTMEPEIELLEANLGVEVREGDRRDEEGYLPYASVVFEAQNGGTGPDAVRSITLPEFVDVGVDYEPGSVAGSERLTAGSTGTFRTAGNIWTGVVTEFNCGEAVTTTAEIEFAVRDPISTDIVVASELETGANPRRTQWDDLTCEHEAHLAEGE